MNWWLWTRIEIEKFVQERGGNHPFITPGGTACSYILLMGMKPHIADFYFQWDKNPDDKAVQILLLWFLLAPHCNSVY